MPATRMRPFHFAWIVVLVAAVGAMGAALPGQARAQVGPESHGGPHFRLNPANVTVVGTTAQVQLLVDPNGVSGGVGAWVLHLNYDGTKVSVTCADVTFLTVPNQQCTNGTNRISLSGVANPSVTAQGTQLATITVNKVGQATGSTPLTLAIATVQGSNPPAEICLNVNGPLDCDATGATVSLGGGNCSAPTIQVASGYSGHLWCGSQVSGANAIAAVLPVAVSQVFHFDNGLGGHVVWFRTSSTTGSGNLTALNPGSFYIFNASTSVSVNVPNPGSFTIPPPGTSFNTTIGYKSQLWSGSFVPLANMASILPSQVTQVFAFDNALGGYTVWFRTGPSTGLGNLSSGGLTYGRTYIFVANASVVVVMN